MVTLFYCRQLSRPNKLQAFWAQPWRPAAFRPFENAQQLAWHWEAWTKVDDDQEEEEGGDQEANP